MKEIIMLTFGAAFTACTVLANPGLVRLHQNMDVNQDDLVTESEFLAMWEDYFKGKDANKDGQLNGTECSAEVLKQADKNQDGIVTFAEDRALRKAHFQSMDKDGDRSLTLPEMLRTAAKPAAKPTAAVAKASAANPHLVKLHKTADTSQDGLVSNAEFVAYWRTSFDQRDKDKNRQLTAAETGAGIMKFADKNKDGVLFWEEEQQLRQGHFESMDKDRDQHLTLEEILATASGSSKNAKPTRGAVDFAAQRAKVAALSNLTKAPAMHRAAGFDSTDNLVAIYYEALDWKGKPTKVFAWIGMPDEYTEDVPAVVLVHGGGGTAFKNWVQEWNARGYAAISIAVEGQTDKKIGKAWESHAWAGPKRNGIYHDSGESLENQWMYHAVADTILANSLIRSIKGVDADRVGIMGISWGGVIASTVIGIDDRFTFAIPTYGCGGLATAANQYGNNLSKNETYKQVWDPMLRLNRVAMPSLWFSWPEDSHFPMDCFAANYGKVAGEHMVSLVPKMGHGHGPPWSRPESYAFADSVVNGAEPWCEQVDASLQSGVFHASFKSTKALNAAVLVSTTDTGVSSDRAWVESPATIVKAGAIWTASAKLPAGTTAWFINVISGDLIASSDYQQAQ